MSEETVTLQCIVDVDLLVRTIADDLSHEGVLDLVKKLDLEMQDYDFTKQLRDYFVQEIKDENKAIREAKKNGN